MSDINIFIVQGRTTKRPPTVSRGNKADGTEWVCGRFSIANSQTKKQGTKFTPITNWIQCVTWSQSTIDELSKPENAGALVLVTGKLSVRDDPKDTKKRWTEVVCDRVTVVLRSSMQQGRVPPDVGYAVDEGVTEEAYRQPTVDDDVPFSLFLPFLAASAITFMGMIA